MRLYMLTIALVLALLGIQWLIGQTPYAYRFEETSISSDIASIDYKRADLIDFALDRWMEKPILGYGVGQFRVLHRGGGYSHNNYVELLANNGIIGFLLYYSLFIAFLRKSWLAFQNENISHSQLAWIWAFIVSLLVSDISTVSYYSKHIWLSFALLIALIYFPRTDASNDAEPSAFRGGPFSNR